MRRRNEAVFVTAVQYTYILAIPAAIHSNTECQSHTRDENLTVGRAPYQIALSIVIIGHLPSPKQHTSSINRAGQLLRQEYMDWHALHGGFQSLSLHVRGKHCL
jgi:hypothetical protein